MRKRGPASAGEDCNKVQIYLKTSEGFDTFGEFGLLMCGEKQKKLERLDTFDRWWNFVVGLRE